MPIRCHGVWLASIVALCACSRGSGETPTRGAGDSLVGTWRAVEYAGKPVRAYLVYDPTGHVFFQSILDPKVIDSAGGRWRGADSAGLSALVGAVHSYYGTYVVHRQAGTVVHRLEGEFPPHQGAMEIATPYRIAGDTLLFGRDSVPSWRFLRVR
jgi:hypothetical protein